MIRRFLALAVIGLLGVPALAQAQQGGAIPDVPEALEALVERGAQIRYLGREHGMDGWIAVYQGQEQYYYITPDKKAFVTGLMFGQDGRPITIDQVRSLQAQGGALLDLLIEGAPGREADASAVSSSSTTPSRVGDALRTQSPGERMFAEIENSNWIALGSSDAPVMYSFVDPQCPHCHEMIRQMRNDYIEGGRIQLRMVPVGFQPGSLAQAAFLLAAPNGAELFLRFLDGDEDALPAQNTISTHAIQRNMALMQAWRFNVTPLNVYRAKDGTVKIVRGVPKDLPALSADIAP